MKKILFTLHEEKYLFSKHFIFLTVYTLIITAFVSYFTYVVLISKTTFLQKKLFEQTLMQLTKQTQTSVANAQEDKYIEQNNTKTTEASASAGIIFHGPRDKKQIALTFDAEMTDGMRANYLSGRVKDSYDKRIVDILGQTNTKATLFLTGMWIELYPSLTKELSDNPLFELGSHSYTDSSFHGDCEGLKQLPQALHIEDIGATEKLLREHAGIDNQLFQFPGGCSTPEDIKLVNQANSQVIHWDVQGNDGFNNNTQQIIHNITDKIQNGSIILLHLNGAPTAPKTADALPTIISTLKQKGFEFVKISELLNLPVESRVTN